MKNKIVFFNAPELEVIEKSKADKIKETFVPMATMLSEFDKDYNKIISDAKKEITGQITIQAKRLRLDIGNVRIQTDKLRVSQKEEYLRAGKAIDGVSNILKWAVIEKENKLKEIENHFEIQEQNRLEKLQSDRAEKLANYCEDAFERDLSKLANDEFDALFVMKKEQQEDMERAEKKAEEERLDKERAETEKRQRMIKENELLKKEAMDRERLAKIDSDKRAKVEIERTKKEKIERDKIDAQLAMEREKTNRIEREEKEKREKLEAELKQRREAELKIKQDEEAQIQAELTKDDATKLSDLIDSLECLKLEYVFKSAKNKKMYNDVGLLIDKVIGHIKK